MNKKKGSSHITPEEFEQQFHQACIFQETGKIDEALLLYNKLLTLLPGSPLLHFNCGLAHFEKHNFVKAESHYGKAIEVAADDPDIHYNRGLNFRRLKKYKDAAKSFEEAFRSGDTSVDTLYNLALCHQDQRDYPEASRLYDIILSQDSKHLSSLNNYAYLCHKSGATERAATLYERLLKLNPDHKAARHMLSSLNGTTPDTAPLDYVESVFDNYADTFEYSLVETLHYKTPEALYVFYCQVFPDITQQRCLDLGCGTGLAGEKFRKLCQELVGIDISTKMLAIANEKNLYDKLIKDDIIHFLQTNNQKYNLITAADVFTYLGDLENIFKECSDSIEQSGVLLFSVEETYKNDSSFELKQTGRFGHSVLYIKTLCKQTGWTILGHKFSNLRLEKGEWIKGHLYILQKRPAK